MVSASGTAIGIRRNSYETCKRALDITLAAAGLLVTAPLWPLIVAAIRLDSPGSALFQQERVGRNGSRFRLLKFRSMRIGTPTLSTAQLNRQSGTRAVTRVGALLRRMSIDELPQLINVLKGEMSLVGPRPALPTQTDLLEMRRLNGSKQLLPGITGWAQINGRDDLDDVTKASLDADYLKLRSLKFDLKILGRTFAPVLTGRGIDDFRGYESGLVGTMRFNRISRRIVAQICIDTVLITGANAAAFLLKYGPGDARMVIQIHLVLVTLPFLIFLRVVALWRCHLYRIHWRYMSIRDLWAVTGATAISSALFYILLFATGKGGQGAYSWGMQTIDAILNILFISGVRVGYRQASDRVLLGISVEPETPVKALGDETQPTTFGGARIAEPAPRPRQRALIVGAGDAGEAVARDLLRRPQEGIIPIGFVDDDPLKRRIRIHGLAVMGTIKDIYELTVEHRFDIILIAMPKAPGRTLRDILARCEQTKARLCIMPSVPEMLSGSIRMGPMRDIHIEDLLRRDAVHIDMESIATYISGQRVLITGGGGSIGSELCRQICALNPARLLVLGRGENSVFEIEQELVREFGFAPTALIGDVQDRNRMEEIFLQERPTVVFHAAAHKHVPLMEANPQEAVKNNIEGTRNMAELAALSGVKKFIYVSTDKAVNPSSVMGATKRIGEMIIQSMAATTQTEFAAVRFGNVLGSRGSVIPTMRKQIARGGPVTVTDPAMTRFFMTIPEAVQLILQAGVLGRHGEIFLLDMGEPVRILDLARDLIRLSGLRPDVDIRIEFSGIRPGEKINEELLYSDEERNRSVHEKIFVSNLSETVSATQVMREVDRLIRLAREGERGDTLRDEVLRVARCTFPRPNGAPVIAAPPPAPTKAAGSVGKSI